MTDNPTQAPFKWALSDAKDSVMVEIDGTIAKLTSREIEIVIRWLGHIRDQMQPSVPQEFEHSTGLLPVESMYTIPAAPLAPVEVGCRFLFRSSQFGWFCFAASADGCRGLLRSLTEVPVVGVPPTIQ